MGKIIFYPFSLLLDNTLSYVMTLQLAKKKSAKVICFAVVEKEEELDDAYLHLLDLHGYYQTTVNNWQDQKVIVEKAIKVGDLKSMLFQYIKNEKVDIIINQPPILGMNGSLLDKLLQLNIKIFSFLK